MGRPKQPAPVKLVCGFIFQDNNLFEKAKRALIKKLGPVDYESDQLPFNHTDYYEKELGRGLWRKFVSFRKLISARKLSAIKLLSNRVEKSLSRGSLRRVNIDPGYLDLAKLILASTKDYSHRVYIGNGIFAEVTLCYFRKSFQPWPWTYPDYKSSQYIRVFNLIRQIYAREPKK